MKFIIVAIVWILIDLYCFQAIKTVTSNINSTTANVIKYTYWIFDILLISIILFSAYTGKFIAGPNKEMSILFGLMILSLAPKIILLP